MPRSRPSRPLGAHQTTCFALMSDRTALLWMPWMCSTKVADSVFCTVHDQLCKIKLRVLIYHTPCRSGMIMSLQGSTCGRRPTAICTSCATSQLVRLPAACSAPCRELS